MTKAAAEGEPGATTAERILLAGIAEFGRLGFAGASTASIVGAAGCNVRMLYHYFGSKDGLYRAALERVYAELRAAERALVLDEADPQGSIERFVGFTFDYMLAHPEFARMMRAENLNGGVVVRRMGSVFETVRPLMGRLGALVEAGIAMGVFRRRIAPEHLYLDILALSFVHISNGHTAGALLGLDLTARPFLATRRREAVGLILSGLRARDEDASDPA